METATVTPENELAVVVNESGLEAKTATTLLDSFTPLFEQAKQWKEKADALQITDASQVDEMKLAREARLALKAIRVQADKVRIALKEDTLRYNKAVQGVYNVIEYLIVPIEKDLEAKEKFAEMQEAKRKEALKLERKQKLEPFGTTTEFYMLADMSEEAFTQLYNNEKIGYETRIAEQRRVEQERIAAEQKQILTQKRRVEIAPYLQFVEGADAEFSDMNATDFEAYLLKLRTAKADFDAEQQKIREDNERLRKEAEQVEAAREAEREAADKLLREQQAKAEAEAKKLREEQEREIAKEVAERKLIEAQLQAQKDAEAKRIADEEAAREAELSKGDKDKLQSLIADIEALQSKYTFKSKKYRDIQTGIKDMLNKTANWAIGKQ